VSAKFEAKGGAVMFAVIGRVKIRPGQEKATLTMIAERGVAMVRRRPPGSHARARAPDAAEPGAGT